MTSSSLGRANDGFFSRCVITFFIFLALTLFLVRERPFAPLPTKPLPAVNVPDR